jgi:four helix bundle protein
MSNYKSFSSSISSSSSFAEMNPESSEFVSNPRAPQAFDHEKLRAYQQLLCFVTWVTPLIEQAKTIARGKTAEVCDQLDRASLSALLNTAEGNGKRQGRVRAKYFDDARGSATECAACLDALVAKGVFESNRIAQGKLMLVQIVSMLCGLVARFDEPTCQCREDEKEYRIDDALISKERKRMRTRTRKTL